MPTAPTNTSPSSSAKCFCVQSDRESGFPQRITLPPRVCAREPARAKPFSVKAKNASFICSHRQSFCVVRDFPGKYDGFSPGNGIIAFASGALASRNSVVKGGVVQAAALIAGIEKIANQQQRRLADAFLRAALCQGAHSTADDLFIGPGCLIDDRRRRICLVTAAQAAPPAPRSSRRGGQKQHHGSLMLCHGSQLFLFRHRGASCHTGDNQTLAHAGQGVLCVQAARCAAKAGNTGGVVIGNAFFVQCVHLLPDGTKQAGISGVKAHGHLFRLLPCGT